MHVDEPGYIYDLEHHENPYHYETIHFIRKEEDMDGNLSIMMNGTTNEEVLRALIHRMKFLNDKLPSLHNILVISNLEESLLILEERTRSREERGVEGTSKK